MLNDQNDERDVRLFAIERAARLVADTFFADSGVADYEAGAAFAATRRAILELADALREAKP